MEPATSQRIQAVSDSQIKSLLDASIPENTKIKQQWAMRLFNTWLSEWRTRINDGHLVVLKELNEFTKE